MMPSARSILQALGPLGRSVMSGRSGSDAKDRRTSIAFAVAFMRILACLRSGLNHDESLGSTAKAGNLCLKYIVALAPKGSSDRRWTLEAYEQSLISKEPDSGDEEIIAAL